MAVPGGRRDSAPMPCLAGVTKAGGMLFYARGIKPQTRRGRGSDSPRLRDRLRGGSMPCAVCRNYISMVSSQTMARATVISIGSRAIFR